MTEEQKQDLMKKFKELNVAEYTTKYGDYYGLMFAGAEIATKELQKELDKFLDENLGELELNKKQAGTILGFIKGVGICSYLAGLKAGRPKWHKVAGGDYPPCEKGNYTITVLTNEGDIAYYSYNYDSWIEDSAGVEIDPPIAWCEIPKF